MTMPDATPRQPPANIQSRGWTHPLHGFTLLEDGKKWHAENQSQSMKMEILENQNAASRDINGSQFLLTTVDSIMEIKSSAGQSSTMPPAACSVPAHQSCLDEVVTTFEPLKVCLDDDSSIEDEDEDMFDDDAFTFGDEDFETLMSHETMRRISASMSSSQIFHSKGRPASPTSAAAAAQNSLLPLHQSTFLLPEKAAGISDPGVDSSLPSTAASSSASLVTLTITSHTSINSISKKTRSKRRVSLHNDVTVVPIPMRSEYSNFVRERIWSSGSELYQNAARNTLEFAAEGFDWRNVADDEHMVISPSGERIHPIHFMNIANLGLKSLNCGQQNQQVEVNLTSVSMEAEPVPS